MNIWAVQNSILHLTGISDFSMSMTGINSIEHFEAMISLQIT